MARGSTLYVSCIICISISLFPMTCSAFQVITFYTNFLCSFNYYPSLCHTFIIIHRLTGILCWKRFGVQVALCPGLGLARCGHQTVFLRFFGRCDCGQWDLGVTEVTTVTGMRQWFRLVTQKNPNSFKAVEFVVPTYNLYSYLYTQKNSRHVINSIQELASWQ